MGTQLGHEFTFKVSVRSPHRNKEIEDALLQTVKSFVAEGDYANGYVPSVVWTGQTPFFNWHKLPWTPPVVGQIWRKKSYGVNREILWVNNEKKRALVDMGWSEDPHLVSFYDLEHSWEKVV